MIATGYGAIISEKGYQEGLDKVLQGDSRGLGDEKIRCAAQKLLTLTEGNLGALIMIVAGIGTIIASAFGAYRAATSLLAVALGSFVLRSLVAIFFNASLDSLPASCTLGGSHSAPELSLSGR